MNKYLIARSNDQIEGVIEVNGKGTFICNLATNPRNIMPPDVDYQPVNGAAQALIGAAIVRDLEQNGKFEETKLYSLNNLVKQIYDHFGYRVDDHGTIIHRPPHPKFDDKTKSNTKTDWHTHNDMKLSEPEAKAFMKKIADQGYIEIPSEIQRWMDS
jgi:hypothetical protein